MKGFLKISSALLFGGILLTAFIWIYSDHPHFFKFPPDIERSFADTETRYASSHITGDFASPTNAVGATTGTWAGVLNTNSNYTSRWAMDDPSPTVNGSQTIAVLARKGSNSNTPTIAINLYENGTLVQSIVGATNVTSTTGQTISGNFNASVITNFNNVEIEVVEVGAGGSPSARNSAQIDYIEWTVNYTPPNDPPTLTVDQPDGVSDTVEVGQSYNIQYDLADSDNTVTAAFFYDTNNSGLDGTAITGACATAAEGIDATCSWDTTGVTPGSYYVYGTTTDGVNPEVSDYSSGQITITAPNLSWATGAADFEIWQSTSTTWDSGTLVCSATLTDDNASTVSCTSGSISASTQYRIQMVLENDGGASADMMGSGEYIEHIAVKGGWAGTSPTLGACAFNDIGTDDGATTCSVAFNTNDVRITNTGGGNVVLAASGGSQGFSYLVVTDTDAPETNSTSYANALIDLDTENSSKITISGPSPRPSMSAVSIDSGAAAIDLIEGTTKNVICEGTATDLQGFADITGVQADLYRTSIGHGGSLSDNNHYQLSGDGDGCVPSNGSGNSETYTCTFAVQFFAEPTDAGSTHAGEEWTCRMIASDSGGTGAPATDTIEMNTLLALNVTSSINYGDLGSGQDTGSTNATTTITNTGNAEIDIDLRGTNMTSGGNTLAVGEQKYNTANFTYSSGGTVLSGTDTNVSLELAKPVSTTPVTDNLYWGINIPSGQALGTYTGTNTFTAISDAGQEAAALEYVFSDGTDLFWHKIGGGGSVKIGDSSDLGADALTGGRSLVHTSDGTMYVVASFLVSGSDYDVSVWRSTDSGATWIQQDTGNRPNIDSIYQYVSAATDGSDNIHITYYDPAPLDQMYVLFNTSTNTFGSPESVFACTTDTECLRGDIAVDSNGIPHVSFIEINDGTSANRFYYANRVGGSWNTARLIALFSAAGGVGNSSIAINEDNIPEISYVGGGPLFGAEKLHAGVGDANNATSFSTTTVDSSITTLPVAGVSSLVVDTSGNTWIAYIDENGGTDFITLVKHNDADSWSTWQTPVTNSNAGQTPSVAADGSNIYIFYEDELDDIVYDVYNGSWTGQTSLETGTYLSPKVKWSFNYDN